jgi:hypothetical protein
MGWLSYFILGDLGQQMYISNQQGELERLRYELERQRNSSPMASSLPIKELQKENDELKLYIAALVRIMVTKGVMTQDELKQMIDTIDTQDGSKDGTFSGNIS